MDAVLGRLEFKEIQIVNPLHPPLIVAKKLKADQGELPAGLILAEAENGELVPYKRDITMLLGTGDGATTEFSTLLLERPIYPGSIVIEGSGMSITDDGYGRLGEFGSAGTVDYKTGKLKVTLPSPPANGYDVVVKYANKPVGILVRTVDTSKDTVGEVLCHGVAVRANLKVGQEAPTDEDLKKLEPFILAL